MRNTTSLRRGSILSSVVLLIIASVVFLSLIVFYTLENKPQWTASDHQKVYNVYAVRTETELSILKLDSSRQASKVKASSYLKDAISAQAMEQIKISYVWETLDPETKLLIEKSLSYILEKLRFKQLSEQSIYIDFPTMKLHSLYSLQSSEFDTVLHNIYEMINKVVLVQLEEDEEELVEIEDDGGYNYEDKVAP